MLHLILLQILGWRFIIYILNRTNFNFIKNIQTSYILLLSHSVAVTYLFYYTNTNNKNLVYIYKSLYFVANIVYSVSFYNKYIRA